MKTFAYIKSAQKVFIVIVVLEDGSEYNFLLCSNIKKKKFKKKILKKYEKIKKVYIVKSYI